MLETGSHGGIWSHIKLMQPNSTVLSFHSLVLKLFIYIKKIIFYYKSLETHNGRKSNILDLTYSSICNRGHIYFYLSAIALFLYSLCFGANILESHYRTWVITMSLVCFSNKNKNFLINPQCQYHTRVIITSW